MEINPLTSNTIENNKSREKSVECIADKLEFECVWLHPEVDMHLVNQFMNQINVFDDNEYGDNTPSNISELLSASFPSGGIVDVSMNEDEDQINLSTSTPQQKDLSDPNCSATKIRQKKKRSFHSEFIIDASPILFTSRNRQVFMRRRCRLSFDDMDDEIIVGNNLKAIKMSENCMGD